MDLPKCDVPEGCVLIGMHALSYSFVSGTFVLNPAEWFYVLAENKAFTVDSHSGSIVERKVDVECSPEEWLTRQVRSFPQTRRLGYLCLRTGDLYVWL